MKKITRRSFMAAAGLTVAALALTACGGSSSTASSAAASSVASSAAASSEAASAAATELTTVEAGKLTMATNAAFPPYEMTTDAGEFEGIDIDTAKAIAEKLAGKKIGTQRGTTGYIYCSDDFGDENVVAYDDGLTAVQALNNGQVDAVVIDNAPAKEFVAANPGLVILDTSYAEEDYAIGVAKGSSLKDAVNAALEELKADGTLQSIVDKYITAE